MKKILPFLLLFVLSTSCTTAVNTYYQVYKTKSQTVKTNDNSIFEDTHCRIDYNLWANYGNPGFSFYNKTDENIYILLEECFFVVNDKAYDYYQNRGFTNSSYLNSLTAKTVSASRIGGLPIGLSTSKVETNSSSNSVAITESKVLIIPPRTFKVISEFNVSELVYRDCDLLRFPSSKQTSSKTFSESNTPLKFYNSITFRVGNNEAKIKVKNDFYVSEISNYSENEMFRLEKNTYCNQKSGTSNWVFNNKATDQFYIKYNKAEGSSWKY